MNDSLSPDSIDFFSHELSNQYRIGELENPMIEAQEPVPSYYKPHTPHSCRRAAFHDYKSRSSYLITFSKDPSAPDFSILTGDPKSIDNPPGAILTPVGEIIRNQIEHFKTFPRFHIPAYIIMPDHVHILWQVKEYMTRDLGFHIGRIKSVATKLWRDSLPSNFSPSSPPSTPYPSSPPALFTPKFNDRIAFDDDMLRKFHNYILDNPRRRLIVKLYPELFQRVQNIVILDRSYTAYGNFQLLRDPNMGVAVISRRYTPEERAKHEKACEEALRTGGVLISPFISSEEKALMHRAIDEGAKIIRLLPDGLDERYKPQGKEFDLCLEGRCLHIGLPRPSAHREELRRDECLRLNAAAHWLAANQEERMRIAAAAQRRK